MSELNYNNFNKHLKSLKKEQLAPIYLFYGDEFLYKAALAKLLDVVMAASEKRLNYEAYDDTGEDIQHVIERINTYSLLAGPKVVAILGSKIFYSNPDVSVFFEKAKTAYDANDIKASSQHLLSLLGKLKLNYDDLDSDERNQRLKYEPEDFGGDSWLNQVISYCRENRLLIPAYYDHADILRQSVEKGFPKGNHLIITTDIVDKRRILYKLILKTGTVIDCSVPRGDRHADKMAQGVVLNEQLKSALSRSGKSMTKEAFAALVGLTGFDLPTFSSNLEKLINYVGDRPEISTDDVEAVLKRTKKDPLYELTNSVAERNLQNAFFFLNSLLSDNFHPLQILAAITNQIRKLLLIKDFTESPHGGVWRGEKTAFNDFKNKVIPAILAYDREVSGLLEKWDMLLFGHEDIDKAGKSKKKSKPKSDLAIVKNPNNPYPVFQMIQKVQRFSTAELKAAFETLRQADVRIKSTSTAPRLILEKAIFSICKQKDD